MALFVYVFYIILDVTNMPNDEGSELTVCGLLNACAKLVGPGRKTSQTNPIS